MVEFAWACVVGTLAYGMAALVLTASAVNRFNDVVDRPRRTGQRPPPARHVRKPAGVDEAGITFVE